jgi:hypothetical protein
MLNGVIGTNKHNVEGAPHCDHPLPLATASGPIASLSRRSRWIHGESALFGPQLPGLVNVNKKPWKDPPCLMGQSTRNRLGHGFNLAFCERLPGWLRSSLNFWGISHCYGNDSRSGELGISPRNTWIQFYPWLFPRKWSGNGDCSISMFVYWR